MEVQAGKVLAHRVGRYLQDRKPWEKGRRGNGLNAIMIVCFTA